MNEPQGNDGRPVASLIKRLLCSLAEIGACISILTVAVGVLGKLHFLCDLASHFRLQSCVAICVSTLVLAFMKRRIALVTGAIGLMMVGTLVPFWLPNRTDASPQYRLLALNVLTSNTDYDGVLKLLHDADPDFILLQETDRRWISKLEGPLATDWPYRKCEPRSDNFGMALWSKIDWQRCDVVDFTDGIQFTAPSMDATFRTANGTSFRLIGTHLLPPMSQVAWKNRNETLSRLANAVQEENNQRTIVTGDFNCTPWSVWFREFTKVSGLRNSAHGQGLAVTWRPFGVAMAGLQIDHALAGEKIEITSRSTSTDVGSDHRAVIVDFAIAN